MQRRKHLLIFIPYLILSLLMTLSSSIWANRMITGTIYTPTGQPAAGVTVKAFDEDDLTGGNDDQMGQTLTDAQGRYSIGRYVQKDWDTRALSDSFRPDIYIKVYQWINGGKVAVGKSPVHEDHNQGQDLTIDLQLKGIMGVVTDRAGNPVGNVIVKAFNENDLSGDDFMNQTRTNANGTFVMTYDQKYECQQILNANSCWDTLLPGNDSYRPDIYIEVHDEIRGRQIKINNKSATTFDVPHRQNVGISETVPRKVDIDYIVPIRAENNPDELNVLAYNVYLRPRSPLFINGQAERIPFIVSEILRDYYDVIVLSEVFDDDLREQLRNKLASTYPYHARVPASDDVLKNDGGVKILSRWPIENGPRHKGEYIIFGLPCLGSDCLSEKGVVYVKINKKEVHYHVFGTHVQADVTPLGELTSRLVRQVQFHKVKHFIDEKKIPANEAVIIAGDLNIDKYGHPDEYADMLNILNAAHPSLVGDPYFRYSIDGKLNDLDDHGSKQLLLDYVLYSKSHRQPLPLLLPNQEGVNAINRVMFYRSDSKWRELDTERFRWDISDHYPVFGSFLFNWRREPIVPNLPVTPPLSPLHTVPIRDQN